VGVSGESTSRTSSQLSESRGKPAVSDGVSSCIAVMLPPLLNKIYDNVSEYGTTSSKNMP
jgi:hypothetical protein